MERSGKNNRIHTREFLKQRGATERHYVPSSMIPGKLKAKQEHILRTKADLLQHIQERIDEAREHVIETGDLSFLSGIVLREMVSRYGEHFSEAEIKEAILYIAQLESIVSLDPLTKVLNRKMLNRDLDRVWAQKERETVEEQGKGTVLAVIDIDHFKKVNTLGGLPAGDITLQELTTIVKTVFRRSTDTLYRYGGEEFVLVMQNTTERDAQRLLETLGSVIQRQLLDRVLARMPDGEEKEALHAGGPVTVSIGFSPQDKQQGVLWWFNEADAALYAAKRGTRTDGHGRNQVQQFGEDLHETLRTVSTERIEKELSVKKETTAGHLSSAHVPTVEVKESDEELFQKYQIRQKERLEKGVVAVQGDPREGLRSLFIRVAERIGTQELFRHNEFQGLEASISYIEQFAYTDALTLLPNALALQVEKERVWSEMHRQGHRYGMILLDLDKFKLINDQFGHSIGDIVLRALGRVLKRSLRRNEFVARIGGEEFCALVESNNEAQFPVIVERVRKLIEYGVMREVSRMCADQNINITFDRERFTATLAGMLMKPEAGMKDGRVMYDVPDFEAVKRTLARALNSGKGVEGMEDPSLIPGYTTSRPGTVGRNRSVIVA